MKKRKRRIPDPDSGSKEEESGSKSVGDDEASYAWILLRWSRHLQSSYLLWKKKKRNRDREANNNETRLSSKRISPHRISPSLLLLLPWVWHDSSLESYGWMDLLSISVSDVIERTFRCAFYRVNQKMKKGLWGEVCEKKGLWHSEYH